MQFNSQLYNPPEICFEIFKMILLYVREAEIIFKVHNK
jgi:hypothetical protein